MRKPAYFLLLLWLVLFVAAFVAPRFVAPTGDGFTRGLNRLGLFFIWHLAAFLVAIIAAVMGWLKYKGVRAAPWVCSAPLLVHLVLIFLVAGVVIFTRFNKPSPVYQPPPKTTAPAAPAAVAEPMAPVESEPWAEPRPDVRQWQGIYRSGFEMSHFHTMDGQGPWWLEAGESDWATLQSHAVDGPGRSGGVTVALSVRGYLEEADPGLKDLTGTDKKIHLTAIESIRPLSPEEFDRVLEAVRKNRQP